MIKTVVLLQLILFTDVEGDHGVEIQMDSMEECRQAILHHFEEIQKEYPSLAAKCVPTFAPSTSPWPQLKRKK